MSAPSTFHDKSTLPQTRWGSRDYANPALIVGIIFLALSVAGLFVGLSAGNPRFFLGWMIGYTFWLGIAVGMLFLIMLTYIFDAGWSIILRRQLEHAVGSIKYLALLFLPLVILGVANADNEFVAWTWMDLDRLTATGDRVGDDPLYVHKAGYLNPAFFVVRFLFIFAIWIVLAELLRRWSFRMDREGDPKYVYRARNLSAVGLFLAAITLTFASIDWFKSLEFHWFSTMYGVWFFSSSIRAAVAALILIAVVAAARGPLKGLFGQGHSYLLGCMLLAFTVFWAYIGFCQYFLIYNANIPEEVFWYNIREMYTDGSKSSWWWVSMALIFGGFLAPFILLLWNRTKFGAAIVAISIWILAFYILDLYFNILPGKVWDPSSGTYLLRQFQIHWMDVTTFLGTGGICVWAFLKSSAAQKAIPIRDPRIAESLNCHA